MQSARGTFGSGGVFDPGRNERADGADTVAWLRAQSWFTGTFATLGPSYLGFTQWALLADPPPEMAAAVISVGPHDFGAAGWRTGSFALSDVLGWSDLVARQERGGLLGEFLRQTTESRRLRPALKALPPAQAGRALLGDSARWYESWLEHADVSADYWQPVNMAAALDNTTIPVLIVSGWQDVFLDQSLQQYRRLRDRGVDVALTVGPWTHYQVGGKGARTVVTETMEWFAEHLAGAAPRQRATAVRVYRTGAERWHNLADWPPPTAEKVCYLQPGRALGDALPPAGAVPSTFVYDPACPTPTIGGRLLSPEGGYRNDDRLALRADVLSFDTAPLAEPLDVIGTPVVELVHRTDTGFADVFVRISEVDPAGRSRNVSDGYLRVHSNSPAPLSISLDAIAHRFAPGSRVRLLIAGGSYPRYARNLGTGEPLATGTRITPSTHEIGHGQGGASRLVLPVATPAP